MSYTFNFTEAQNVIEGINKVTNDIDTALNTMESTVEKSLAEWTGNARTEYTAAKASWDQSALDMATHLNAARIALTRIHANYGETELRNQQSFADLGGGR